jgi:uncharacterized membrane protein
VTGRLWSWKESVRTGFWAIPSLCVVLAVTMALVLLEVDQRREQGGRFTFAAGPDGAREVLSAISTSMITFTGLVFSITIVVLQLTSSQFSPRVLRTFLRDRQTQLSLGIFVATFVYAVTVLRTVSAVEDNTFVPAVATTAGLLLLLVSVAVFVSYIHHIATAIQVSSIMTAIGDETREAIKTRYPSDTTPGPSPVAPAETTPSAVLVARRSGVVTRVSVPRLVDLAAQADVVLSLRPHLGDFVPEGAPLLDVLGDAGRLDVDAVMSAITLARDRSMDQDVAFGLRQLVDIAERALSPGVNDPTTAVQALDQVHDVLRRLATRPLGDGRHAGDDGRLRLVTPPETFDRYAGLALREVEQYGADSLQVQDRLAELRRDVRTAARPEHRDAPALRG